jgi:type II secretory pathway pseudopilin PulG
VTRSSRRHPAAGYSLVELLVSALLFAIIGTGSVTLFSLTVRQQTRTEGLQAEQFAISIDEANLQRMNDRFTCQSGTCVIKTGTAPNQNEYYPLVGSAAEATFLALCSPTSSGAPALADPLVALINAAPPTVQMARLGISRQAVREAETVAQPFAHRYTITWRSRDDTILRQNTLVPTTAGWCP